MVDRPIRYTRRGEKMFPDTLANRFRRILDLPERTRSRSFVDGSTSVKRQSHRPEMIQESGSRETSQPAPISDFLPQRVAGQNKVSTAVDQQREEELQTEVVLLTPQEGVVYAHAFRTFFSDFVAPEEEVVVGVKAEEIQSVLMDDLQKQERQLKRVMGRGEVYYLDVRNTAVEKMSAVIASGNYGDLESGLPNLVLTAEILGLDYVWLVHSGIAEMNPEKILGSEFLKMSEAQKSLQETMKVIDPIDSVQGKVEEYVREFEVKVLLDIANGIPMYVAWAKFGRLTAKRIHQLLDAGVVQSLGKDSTHNMDLFTREDILIMLWVIDHKFDLKRISEEQIEELSQVRQEYRKAMEEKISSSYSMTSHTTSK